MYKTLISALVVVLSACGTVGNISTNYSAQGTWEGLVVNNDNPYDSLNVRFSLYDKNGSITGYHWYYDGYWKYLGTISGQRNGKSASWAITGPGGSIQINGTFDGDSFRGTYNIYLNSGSNLNARLSLTRTSTIAQSSSQVPTEGAENLSNLFHRLQ